jgi:CheY-like chemotaxis protein
LHAGNGKIAVDKAIENPDIDLILMDIRMPLLDGYEATKQIREFNKDVPIIAQTAFAEIPEHNKVLMMGFTDFFAKPLEENVLNKIIQQYGYKN